VPLVGGGRVQGGQGERSDEQAGAARIGFVVDMDSPCCSSWNATAVAAMA